MIESISMTGAAAAETIQSAQSAKSGEIRSESQSEQSDISAEMQLRKRDRLELSSEYVSSVQENTEAQEAVSSDSESSSEEVDTTKLYTYTDSELKDLLIDGSITQSEYNTEIAKREN